MRMCHLAILVAVAWAIPTDAEAGIIYNVSHQSLPGGPNIHIGPQSTPIDYDYHYQISYFAAHDHSEVYAEVNQGNVGINASAFNDGTFSPQGPSVSATESFDVIFRCPGTASIDVIMNMSLSGLPRDLTLVSVFPSSPPSQLRRTSRC